MEPLKIALFSCSVISAELITTLHQSKRLAGVIVGFDASEQHYASSKQLIAYLQQQGIPYCRFDTSAQRLHAQLTQWEVNMGIAFNFPHIFTSSQIALFNGELVNLHASDLPNYRGPLPTYWQLRHGRTRTALTLHRIECSLDDGAIGHQCWLDIHPFDTLQTLGGKIQHTAPKLIEEYIELRKLEKVEWRAQRKVEQDDFYARGLTQDDLYLDWATMTPKELVNATRAGNPAYGGLIMDSAFGCCQLLQVTERTEPTYGSSPGTVMCIDRDKGLLVATHEGCVSLDLLATPYGHVSGYRFAILSNMTAGVTLTSNAFVSRLS